MAFNPMQATGTVQITKRPITDQEQSQALAVYGSLRNGSRGVATASMFMAVLNVAILSGTLPLGDLAILFTILALVLGLAAMGVGAMTLKVRRQIDAAFREGRVIEVRAPAYLNRAGGGKVAMWNVGPVSVMQTLEMQGLLAEGMPAKVVCVPRVKAALSVNGVALKRGASLTMPPNLEAMATAQEASPSYPPMQPPAAPRYPEEPRFQPQPPPQQAQPQFQPRPYPPQPEQPQYPPQPVLPAYPQPQQPQYPPQPMQPAYPQPQQPQPYAAPQPQYYYPPGPQEQLYRTQQPPSMQYPPGQPPPYPTPPPGQN